MAIIVNTNSLSLISQRNLTNATNSLNTSLERMSTGYKINSAKDDAAGMYIATNMDTQIRGSKVAQSNVAIGSNLLKVAEGDLNVITKNLQRVRDLATQAANGVYSTESMTAMKDEVTARSAEITRIATASKFNDMDLLSGTGPLGTSGLRLQVGANANSAQNSLNVASSVFGDAKADTLGLTTSAITAAFASASAAAAFIATVDTALKGINTRTASIGAYQNRLDSAATSLVTNIENTSAAKSTIMDADIAEESSNYTKAQILQQTTAALLTQANQLPSLALKLIG